MAVYDRWHKDAAEGDQPCKCSKGRNRLYPSAVHGQGKRWQVRWDDPTSATRRQPRRNFALRDPGPGELADPEKHASAYDALIQGKIVTRNYTDPNAGNVTLHDNAETWRQSRGHDANQAEKVERRLRLHVYEGEPGSGLTPRGAPSIGQHPMGLLESRPSLVAAWAAAIPLAPQAARHVMGNVSAIFTAAAEDGIVRRNPLKMSVVHWPDADGTTARAWPLASVQAIEAKLPERWRIIPPLGAGTAMRQGEMLGLGTGDIRFLGRDPRVSVVRQLKIVGGELRFAPLKTRKPHDVPLAESLARRLARHLELFPAHEVTLPWHDPRDRDRHGKPVTVRLVITDDKGAAVRRNVLANSWSRAARRAKVTPEGERARDDGCHALRHTAASTWLRAGIDVVRVAAWMGDTPQMVWQTYAHMIPGDSGDDGRLAVDGFFAGPSAPDVPSAAEG
jgi:integrase